MRRLRGIRTDKNFNDRKDKTEVFSISLSNVHHLKLKLAVTIVHFEINHNWYFQRDGLAMGLSLAVVLPIIWINSFEEKLCDESQTPNVRNKDPKEKCPDCH